MKLMPDTLFPLPEEQEQQNDPVKGKPRLETANRQQIEMRMVSLDQLLPENHRARLGLKAHRGFPGSQRPLRLDVFP